MRAQQPQCFSLLNPKVQTYPTRVEIYLHHLDVLLGEQRYQYLYMGFHRQEFQFEYSNSLYDNYEKCIDKGIMYNDAHLVVDTMLIRFRKMIDEKRKAKKNNPEHTSG